MPKETIESLAIRVTLLRDRRNTLNGQMAGLTCPYSIVSDADLAIGVYGYPPCYDRTTGRFDPDLQGEPCPECAEKARLHGEYKRLGKDLGNTWKRLTRAVKRKEAADIIREARRKDEA